MSGDWPPTPKPRPTPRVTVRTLGRWVAEGHITAYTVSGGRVRPRVRVDLDELDQFLQPRRRDVAALPPFSPAEAAAVGRAAAVIDARRARKAGDDHAAT